jgi:hypothetical protein
VRYEKEFSEGANRKPPRQILPLGAFEFQEVLNIHQGINLAKEKGGFL